MTEKEYEILIEYIKELNNFVSTTFSELEKLNMQCLNITNDIANIKKDICYINNILSFDDGK